MLLNDWSNGNQTIKRDLICTIDHADLRISPDESIAFCRTMLFYLSPVFQLTWYFFKQLNLLVIFPAHRAPILGRDAAAVRDIIRLLVAIRLTKRCMALLQLGSHRASTTESIWTQNHISACSCIRYEWFRDSNRAENRISEEDWREWEKWTRWGGGKNWRQRQIRRLMTTNFSTMKPRWSIVGVDAASRTMRIGDITTRTATNLTASCSGRCSMQNK